MPPLVVRRLQRLDASGLPGWQRQALLLFAFVLIAAPIVGFRVVNNESLSNYDEWQYSDRVVAVTDGNVLMSDGETFSPWGQRVVACRGIQRVVPPASPRCSVPPGQEPLPNYASADPQPYFVITGLAADVLLETGVVDAPLVAGRLIGILWAGLSMWTLWLLTRAFGATRLASAVVASTVLLVPLFIQQYTFITPHALDIPVGAFTALTTLKYLRRQWPVWMLAVAALTIVGVKSSNVVIAVAVGITFGVIIVWPGVERSDRLRAFVGGAVLTVSTVAFFVAYQVALNATRVATYDLPGSFVKDHLDWYYVSRDSVTFIAAFGEDQMVVFGAWMVLAMAGTAMAVWAGLVPNLPPFVRQLAPGYLLGAAIGALVLDVMVYITTSQQFGVHLRYGLAVFPLGLAFAALLLRTRTAIVLAAATLVLYAVTPTLIGLDSTVI